MKYTKLNEGLISGFLERYRSIKVHKPDTLFDVEPNWEKLEEDRCPICGNRLNFPLNKKIAICRGKRHGNKKAFLIKIETLVKIKAKNKAIKSFPQFR